LKVLNKSYYIGLLVFFIFSPVICSPAFGAANPDLFPRPAALEPAVQFWTRVFTEIDTKHGFIHDDRNLSVIYETIKLPNTKSRRRQQRYVNKVKKHYIRILKKLATGKRHGLSAEEQRVLDLWPKNVSNRTLRRAVRRIRFQLGQSNKYKDGLIRSGAWKPHILKTLKDMGLPKEIAALPHVESSFNPNAYSRVGASGLWQFTRSTGRRFMRIDHVVDERMNPFKATVAAAQLLENNYAVTGTWPLALTAYNHGAAGMRYAAKKMGTTDIDVIVAKYHSRTFKFASRNFYVAFLAAVDVEQQAEKYFGPLTLNPPIEDGIVKVPDYMSPQTVANALGVTVTHLKRKNPALRPTVWNGNKYIPRGYKLRYDKSRVDGNAKRALAMIAASHRYARQKPDLYHRVRRGQTLSTIAARYHVRVRDIMALNGLRSKHFIRAGQRLRLPQPAGKRTTLVARASNTPMPPPKDGQYTVRRGDTVSRIAHHFGLEPKQILAYNDLRMRTIIYPGQTLRVTPKPKVARVEAAQAAHIDTHTPTETGKITVAKEDSNDQDNPLQLATADNTSQDISLENSSQGSEAIDGGATTPQESSAGTENSQTADEDHKALVTATNIALLEAERATQNAPDATDASDNAGDTDNDNATTPTDESPEAEASQLDENAPAGVAVIEDTQPDLTADPSDYSVADNNTIEVQAAETLGHYAEWLDLRASRLRHINRMRYGKPVVIGKRLKLDFSRVSHDEFEKRRIEYHRVLQEAFFEQFQINGSDEHKIKHGESVWILAKRKYNVPIWLLRQYNPDLSLEKIRPGMIIKFPRVEERQEPETDPEADPNTAAAIQSVASKID
jgi:membrane-bound lytic murein transglycosylase D